MKFERQTIYTYDDEGRQNSNIDKFIFIPESYEECTELKMIIDEYRLKNTTDE